MVHLLGLFGEYQDYLIGAILQHTSRYCGTIFLRDIVGQSLMCLKESNIATSQWYSDHVW